MLNRNLLEAVHFSKPAVNPSLEAWQWFPTTDSFEKHTPPSRLLYDARGETRPTPPAPTTPLMFSADREKVLPDSFDKSAGQKIAPAYSANRPSMV